MKKILKITSKKPQKRIPIKTGGIHAPRRPKNRPFFTPDIKVTTVQNIGKMTAAAK